MFREANDYILDRENLNWLYSLDEYHLFDRRQSDFGDFALICSWRRKTLWPYLKSSARHSALHTCSPSVPVEPDFEFSFSAVFRSGFLACPSIH